MKDIEHWAQVTELTPQQLAPAVILRRNRSPVLVANRTRSACRMSKHKKESVRRCRAQSRHELITYFQTSHLAATLAGNRQHAHHHSAARDFDGSLLKFLRSRR